MPYHVKKRNNNSVIVTKTKNKTTKGWSNLAKGINRAERTRREIEQILKNPVFAEYKGKLRGSAFKKYGLSGIIEEKPNGKLGSYKSNRNVATYQTQRDRNRWKKWFKAVQSGKIKPTDDRYASGLMDRQALANKHLNLTQFRNVAGKRAKLSLRKRVQFGISSTMYDSDTLASRDYGMSFDQVSDLGKEMRNGNFKTLNDWKKSGHTSKSEVDFYNDIMNNQWDRKRDLIAKERKQAQMFKD